MFVRNTYAGHTGNEDVIIQDVLKDIEIGGYSRTEGVEDCFPKPADQADEVRAEGDIDVQVPAQVPVVEGKELSIPGVNEENSDVPPAVTGGSESTNSGNVNELVNSFFLSPPVDATLPAGLDSLDIVHASEAPIFDKTPKCVAKVSLNFADNNTEKEGPGGEFDDALQEKDESGVKVYERRKLPRKLYSRALNNISDAEEGAAALISEGASTSSVPY